MSFVSQWSRKKLLFTLFLFVVTSVTIVTLLVESIFWFFSLSLPSISSLSDYRPALGSRIVLVDPDQKEVVVLAEFLKEKRYLAATDEIPKLLVSAFISAEDDQFFKHQGVNLTSIIRAAIANMRAGHVVQGGSTITQQVAKSLLLSPERSFVRKAKELILANRMEKTLSKNEILYLYLNQIYLGHGAYGVRAAAKTYFGKDLNDLSAAEMALLAGMPQAPGKFAPHQSPRKAKERQSYVLRRMHDNGYLSQAEYEAARNEELKILVTESPEHKAAPYLVEHLRRYVLNKYGEDKLYSGGLTVKLSGKLDVFKKAQLALQEGLRSLDRKAGYRGPLERLKNTEDFSKFLTLRRNQLITNQTGYELLTKEGELSPPPLEDKDLVFQLGNRMRALVISEKPLTFGITPGIVANPSDSPDAFLKSATLKKGDVVWVRLLKQEGPTWVCDLDQEPEVQGALYSMDLKTGQVLALEGGYDFKQSEFNRAIQAQRQPGSAFKPFIFAAGLERGFTPVTNIVDAPLVYDDEEAGKWKPKNVDSKFYGDTSFRQALIKSRNIPTIKIVEAIGVQRVIDFSKRIGLNAQYAADLSLALGSSATSLEGLVKGYAVFGRGGILIEPKFFDQILDRDGLVLEESTRAIEPSLNEVLTEARKQKSVPSFGATQAVNAETGSNASQESFTQPENGGVPTHLAIGVKSISLPVYPLTAFPSAVLDPRIAYILTHLMTEVVSYGTGIRAKGLGRPAAGKTGTTDEARDAWFIGFTPDIVTGVWIGYDGAKTLPTGETGSSAALPIWVEVMKAAHEGMPISDFVPPEGIRFVKLSNGVQEAFLQGTEPGGHEFIAPSQKGEEEDATTKKDYVPSQSDFLKEDSE